ncbi:hypothetical protein H0H87_005883 [Tephrocybe sp. NHM501043]|nr:hypothetical protein H0H87_005883 [Tephrocybe sp. NHM501043]
MSVSPDNPRPSPPASPPATTPAGLAKLLADAYADADGLRRELAASKKRTDHAERIAVSLQSLSDRDTAQDNAIDILKKWEQRALAAEQARDDADAKRSAIEASWSQLTQYLAQLDVAASDARAGFARVVEHGGPIVVPPSQVPVLGGGRYQRGRVLAQASAPFPSLPLPPHPSTTGTRRPRTPSIDGYGHPPPKKSRGEYDATSMYVDRPLPPRMILPPPHHLQPPPQHRPSRSRSRDSSRSSSSSTSVGDMIIQASEGQTNGNAPEPAQQPVPARRKHRHDDHRPSHLSPSHFPNHALAAHHYEHEQLLRQGYHPDYQNPRDYRSSPKQASTLIMAGAAASGEPLAQPGQAREFQTHIFAPVVTGAPVKKSKFPQGPAALSATIPAPPAAPHGDAPAPGPPVAAFPATNEQGQRICRQCGMPGRYKEGKCVEKWGPGPMGPGTVCDRCRKKMKRVERRGTLENQQSMGQNALGSSASLSHLSHSRPQSHSALHRSDTLPAISHTHSSFNVSSSRSDFHRSSPRPPNSLSSNNNTNGTPRPARSPGPSIAAIRDIDEDIPTSAVPRGGAGSRSNSRNGLRPSNGTGGRATPVGAGDPKKTSPLKHHSTTAGKRLSGSPGSVMDVDADGEVEDDADEVEAAFEGLVALGEEASSGKAAMEVDGDGAGDAEQELLEAVDAAEANSSSSSNAGRMKEED